MGAAGWHICFDVLERLLAGRPIGRIVGAEAMKFGGWQRLNAEYAKQFGVETPGWPSRPMSMPRSKGMVIGFWIVTALFCLQIGFTAYAQLRLPQVAEAFTTSASLLELGPPVSGPPSLDEADLIPTDLATGQKGGYVFDYRPVNAIPPGGRVRNLKRIKAVVYGVTAEPVQVDGSGVNFFYVDESGVLRISFRTRASPASPPL